MKNFITAEEFLKQPKYIQQVFIDWWKMEVGDLYSAEEVNDEIDIIVRSDEFVYGLNNSFIYDNGVVMKNLKPFPLLQMHQLIQFIEDNTGGEISIVINPDGTSFLKIKPNNEILETECSEYSLEDSIICENSPILHNLFHMACEMISEKIIN